MNQNLQSSSNKIVVFLDLSTTVMMVAARNPLFVKWAANLRVRPLMLHINASPWSTSLGQQARMNWQQGDARYVEDDTKCNADTPVHQSVRCIGPSGRTHARV